MRDDHLWGDDDDGGESRTFEMTGGNVLAVFGLGALLMGLLILTYYLLHR